ncbi:hypothetical protein D3C73_938840 [compost metagenome]
MVGECFDIKKDRARYMASAILLANITIFLPWRRHPGIKNLYFRIVNVFDKPVGSDKEGGGHRHLHFYQVSANCRLFTVKGQVKEADLSGWIDIIRENSDSAD